MSVLCRVHFLSSAAMAVSSCTTMTGVSSSVAALASSNSVLLHGASVVTPTRVVSVCGRATVRSISCRAKGEAEDTVVSTEAAPALPRRLALAVLAGAVVAGSRAAPANAAYGETGQLIPKNCSRSERQQKLRTQIVYNGLPKFLGRLLYAYLHPLLGVDELSG